MAQMLSKNVLKALWHAAGESALTRTCPKATCSRQGIVAAVGLGLDRLAFARVSLVS